MRPSIGMELVALVGLAILLILAAGLGVWLVRSKSGPHGDSADATPRTPESAEMAPAGSSASRDGKGDHDSVEAEEPKGSRSAAPDEEPRFLQLRRRMVESQMQARGIRDARVLEVMRTIPRHRFVPSDQIRAAYEDHPLRIGRGQTISQPYIVALMTELARPNKDSIALDVGTGSGYQAAVLSHLCKEVYSIEIVESLADSARQRLENLGHENVTVRFGDGYRGWPEKAPFDLIIVAAAPDHVPQPLIDQLREGGRLVIPVGDYYQKLMVVEKGPGGESREWAVSGVSFVPMTGEAQD